MTSQFALALAAVLVAGLWISEKCSHHPARTRRAYIAGVWGGFLGARLWYALQYGDFSLVGGWASWGFVFGASLGSVAYLRWARGQWAFGDFADAAAPALALGGAVMRLNCFSIGCNFGSPTQAAWAVTYPPGAPAYQKHLAEGLIQPGASCSLAVHPAQLYESAALFIAFTAILWVRHRQVSPQDAPQLATDSKGLSATQAPRRPWPGGRLRLLPGDLFLGGIVYYSLFRFWVEFIRDDAAGLAFGPLSFAQASSLLALTAALFVLRLRRT
ncbi:MAG TPA: prolipoprotein diacylglyceryl transferase family protein [Acidobacteriota bacterium]|nr:prolipoprotein diacylglyceryl transferase family protein [Acidobacteriota bacterium]